MGNVKRVPCQSPAQSISSKDKADTEPASPELFQGFELMKNDKSFLIVLFINHVL